MTFGSECGAASVSSMGDVGFDRMDIQLAYIRIGAGELDMDLFDRGIDGANIKLDGDRTHDGLRHEADGPGFVSLIAEDIHSADLGIDVIEGKVGCEGFADGIEGRGSDLIDEQINPGSGFTRYISEMLFRYYISDARLGEGEWSLVQMVEVSRLDAHESVRRDDLRMGDMEPVDRVAVMERGIVGEIMDREGETIDRHIKRRSEAMQGEGYVLYMQMHEFGTAKRKNEGIRGVLGKFREGALGVLIVEP